MCHHDHIAYGLSRRDSGLDSYCNVRRAYIPCLVGEMPTQGLYISVTGSGAPPERYLLLVVERPG